MKLIRVETGANPTDLSCFSLFFKRPRNILLRRFDLTLVSKQTRKFFALVASVAARRAIRNRGRRMYVLFYVITIEPRQRKPANGDADGTMYDNDRT